MGEPSGDVSAILVRPPEATSLYVLAHGAGAGMRHPFLGRIAEVLAGERIATLRYQFPYMERKTRRPDPPAVATATVRAAVALAQRLTRAAAHRRGEIVRWKDDIHRSGR